MVVEDRMRVFSGFRAAAIALLALAVSLPAYAAEESGWITIERGVAQRALVGFAAAGNPGALTIMEGGSSSALSQTARDKDVVVARLAVSGVDELAEILHRERHQCGGFMWHSSREEADQAAARANAPGPVAMPALSYTIDNRNVANTLISQVQEVNVRNTIIMLGSFFTRYHNCPQGVQSANAIRDLWQGYATAANRADVTVELFPHTYTNPTIPTMQPSVILTIPGGRLASEIVVLGAHQDSTNNPNNCSGTDPGSRAPGQDDDASGIASLSEVIRVALLAGYHPARTVKFMAYAAEEIGLKGSAQIAQTYQNQGVNVAGVMQLDMTDYKGSTGDVYVYTDFTNPAQNAFLQSLITTYTPTLIQGTDQCGYGCSDHASWTSRGYPASLPFEARFTQYDPFIHTENDTLANLQNNANHALKFSKVAAAFMAELAKGRLTGNFPPPMLSAK
jgi:bacterial leucyl aminopeptidase